MNFARLSSATLALFAVLGGAVACEETSTDTATPDGGGGGFETEGGATECTEIPTDCSTVTPLTSADVKDGKVLPANTCWSVDEDLSLASGTLAVEQGVVVRFGTNKSLRVASGAQVKLSGTCEHRVRFTSKDGASTWKGIYITDSQGADNVWTWAVLENGGDARWSGADYSDAALYLDGSTKLQMDHVAIKASKSHGLIASEQVDFTFANGRFEGNVTPAYLHPQVVSAIPGDVVLEGNTNPYIRVVFGNNDRVAGPKTWAALPLRVEDRFFVAGDLTIEPGAKLEFAQGKSLIVEAGGTLTAKGTADKPVTFAGAAATKGFWQGIRLRSGGVGSPPTIGATFDHVVISEAGGANWSGNPDSKAALYMDEVSAATITNTTFKDSAHYGLWASSDARLPGFASNTFTSNGRVMRVHPDRVGELGSGHALTGNDDDAIHVGFGNNDRVSVPATWKHQGVPYAVTDRFFVAAALTIEEGVTLMFPQDQGMIVETSGSLSVNGTAAKPVTFRGLNEVATGYWQGVHVQSNDPKNSISHATFAHAGVKGWSGDPESDTAIFLANNASVALANVTLGQGGGYGVFIAGSGSSLSCSTVTFTGLVKGAVWQDDPGVLLAGCP